MYGKVGSVLLSGVIGIDDGGQIHREWIVESGHLMNVVGTVSEAVPRALSPSRSITDTA